MAQRRLKDWLLASIEYTENTESPLSYHLWAALSTISATLQRRCYMKWGLEVIYPNQYIVLVGPSGSRKGLPIKIAKHMLTKVGIPTAANKVTKEALIRFMKNSIDNYKDMKTGKLHFQCAISCISEELSVFLGVKDTQFLADLTDWYDSNDEWKYETKGGGVDHIQGVCLNLLAGTAPDWIPTILPHEAIGGGWTSRTMFIVEAKKRKVVGDPDKIPPRPDLYESLLYDLEQIKTISGEVHFSAEAREGYIRWYETEEKKVEAGNPPIMDPRFSHYCARRATMIKKLAMALAASSAINNDPEITPPVFNRALTILEAAEKKMSSVFIGIGKAKFAEATESILNLIISRETITRGEILRRYYRDVDAFTMEAVEKVLLQMQVVKKVLNSATGEVIYSYIPQAEQKDGTGGR